MVSVSKITKLLLGSKKLCISLQLSVIFYYICNVLKTFQQLYLATGNPNSYEESRIPLAVAEPLEGGPEPIGRTLLTSDDSTLWNSSGEQLCVVCQYFPLSRALLPCR